MRVPALVYGRARSPDGARSLPERSGAFETLAASSCVGELFRRTWRRALLMATPEEQLQWIERARGGDARAFEQLVRLHQRRIYRLALHLTGSGGDADDVTQETFFRAYRAIERFDGRAEIFTWLYRICVNVSLNLRRSRRRVTTDLDDPRVPEPVAEGGNPGVSAEQAQSYRALARAMDDLSESLRTTLVLACVEQLPYKDIAQVLGCSEGTVAWRVHEARKRLRDALPDDVIAPLEPQEPAGGARGRRA